MATGRVPTTANSPLTAKGDLFTYSTAPARLAVGNNGDTIVADSSTSTGLRWQGDYAAGKNKIINGDMSVWQRGTTFNSAANGSFTADRYQIAWDSSPTVNASQQTFTPGTAPVAGYESAYFLRVAETAVSSSTVLDVRYRIEDVRTFAGQTATLSFWAKADSARTLTIAAINQDFGVGGSTAVGVTPTTSSFSLTTSWQRFTTTMTFPSIAGKTIGTNNLVSLFLRNTASATLVFDLWGVQWEQGSVATAFNTATGTIQGELAACQRYYREVIFATGVSVGTTSIQTWINHTGMRTAPSVAASAPLKVTNASSTDYTQSVAGISIVGNVADGGRYTSANYTGMTTNQAANLINGGGYIQISAEL